MLIFLLIRFGGVIDAQGTLAEKDHLPEILRLEASLAKLMLWSIFALYFSTLIHVSDFLKTTCQNFIKTL